MSLFGRLFGKARTPAWASFMEASEFNTFVRALNRVLAQRVGKFRLNIEQGYWENLTAATISQSGLVNLAQMCHQVPRGEWRQLIDGFIQSLLTLSGVPQPNTFDEAAPYLKVRLYPLDMQLSSPVVSAPVSDAFRTLLVLDYPQHVVVALDEDVSKWGTPRDQLFAKAMENTGNDVLPELQSVDLPDGGQVSILVGESFFTATHALMLERWMDPVPEEGVLVAVPNRHSVAFHPVLDVTAIGAITYLAQVADRMYLEGPGSVSPKVLWWRKGQFDTFDLEMKPTGMEFRPSQEFLDVLSRLA